MCEKNTRAEPSPQDAETISLIDPRVIIAGIRQFGLAPDGSDLRDLEAAIDRLRRPAPDAGAEAMREVLETARKHIGSMPATGSDGSNRFFETLQVIHQIETALYLDAELRALPLPDGEGWQPIETARVARWERIDLWVEHSQRGGRREADGCLNEHDEWTDRGGNVLDFSFREDKGKGERIASRVTHWRPLPAPPAAKEKT